MTSIKIEQWVREDLKCSRFANMAQNSFQEVRYTIVSALGADFDANSVRPEPLRILDPFLWLLHFAREDLKPVEAEKPPSFWQRLFGRRNRKSNRPALPPA